MEASTITPAQISEDRLNVITFHAFINVKVPELWNLEWSMKKNNKSKRALRNKIVRKSRIIFSLMIGNWALGVSARFSKQLIVGITILWQSKSSKSSLLHRKWLWLCSSRKFPFWNNSIMSMWLNAMMWWTAPTIVILSLNFALSVTLRNCSEWKGSSLKGKLTLSSTTFIKGLSILRKKKLYIAISKLPMFSLEKVVYAKLLILDLQLNPMDKWLTSV